MQDNHKQTALQDLITAHRDIQRLSLVSTVAGMAMVAFIVSAAGTVNPLLLFVIALLFNFFVQSVLSFFVWKTIIQLSTQMMDAMLKTLRDQIEGAKS